MSAKVQKRLKAEFGDAILEADSFRGDERALVALKDWVRVAEFLRDDPACAMNHFGDFTAVDWPERDGERFELVLYVRSVEHAHRMFLRTWVAEDKDAPTLSKVWAGANWAEREVYDMFGVKFAGHTDMRRILLYEEFEGHPLRKDYPIDRAQPLVEYRTDEGTTKLPPFGIDEGQPFARIDWQERLEGRDDQVSPSLALQQGQARALSDSESAEQQAERVRALVAAEPPPETTETQ